MIVFLILGALLALLFGFVIGAISGAPWVPAFKRDIEAVLDDTGLKSGDSFVELGCGDGRVVIAAARRGANVVGYEINPLLWLVASIKVLTWPNARIKLRNFWRVDLSKADVVMTFLVPRTVGRLENKIKREMKPGSRLVSYIFKLPTLKPKLKRHHWLVYYL